MKIERLYSDYQEEERLYSTGNDELDELMECAFCEGYEYAQREFALPLSASPETATQVINRFKNKSKNLIKPIGKDYQYQQSKRTYQKPPLTPEKSKILNQAKAKSTLSWRNKGLSY